MVSDSAGMHYNTFCSILNSTVACKNPHKHINYIQNTIHTLHKNIRYYTYKHIYHIQNCTRESAHHTKYWHAHVHRCKIWCSVPEPTHIDIFNNIHKYTNKYKYNFRRKQTSLIKIAISGHNTDADSDTPPPHGGETRLQYTREATLAQVNEQKKHKHLCL